MKYTIFEHISNLTDKKINSVNYDEDSWRSFSPYMINQWLSMNMNLTEFINHLQKYTIGILTKEQMYKVMLGFLPKKKLYIKYIKGDKTSKYHKELIYYIRKYHKVSSNVCSKYLDIYFNNESGINELKNILKKYGLTKKEITKYIKIQK